MGGQPEHTFNPFDGSYKEVHAFPNCIGSKVSVKAWLYFELTCFEAAVQQFSHYSSAIIALLSIKKSYQAQRGDEEMMKGS